jgi:predicted DNA-binding transcriptional regulator AlpA
MHQSNQLLTVQQVAGILAVGPSQVWAQTSAAPDFPKPIKVSAKQTRWKQSAVDANIEAKSATQH